MSEPHRPQGSILAVAIALLAVMATASTLRAPITAVPPVLDLIGAELAVDPVALGALTALPLVGFSLVSLAGPWFVRQAGPELAVLFALAVLTAAIVLRSVPSSIALWVGTALIGAAIAMGNVLLPVIIKVRWPGHIAGVTGAYTAASAVAAALAAALVIPTTKALGGDWRMALGVSALPTAVAAVIWFFAFCRVDSRHLGAPRKSSLPPERARRRAPIVRSPLAWGVTAFMGLQAATYYALLAWIPSIERTVGVSAGESGWHLALFIGVGIVSGVMVSVACQLMRDQRWLSSSMSALLVVAIVGAITAPQLAVVWVAIAGISSGGVFPVALAFIGLRTRSPEVTAALSGFVQSGGYLLAALGPVLAGVIAAVSDGWLWPLIMIGILATTQTALGHFVGADRAVDDEVRGAPAEDIPSRRSG